MVDSGTMLAVDVEQRAELERVVAMHCAAQRFDAAATAAIEGYGPEVLGYLLATTRREQEAAEIFSDYCEDLWRGLPSFRGESTFRTWSYRLAHNALSRASRNGSRRRKRVLTFSELPELDALAEQVRSRTLPHLRTEVKQEVLRLREQLEDDERTLLILRIDRQLEWDEIARIVDPEASSPKRVKQTSATLRKRFERLKVHLRALAKDLDVE